MKINGLAFYKMAVSAANNLDNNKIAVNNMNVFPVPDGDTGINMTLTVSTVSTIGETELTLAEYSKKVADLTLRSARGNSGAILSLFFRGMAKGFADKEEADANDFANALDLGTKEAYKAVMNPTEGTILTVMRTTSDEALVHAAEYGDDVLGFFTKILAVAEKELARTPEILPVLRQARVVDAGGYGFVIILAGMLASLKGEDIVAADPTSAGSVAEADFSQFATEDVLFAYCTEFIVNKSAEYLGEGKVSEFYRYISDLGDSIVFVDDESIIKVHIHTNHPGKVLEKAIKHGDLATVKIENMKLQHSNKVVEEKEIKAAEEIAAPVKPYGFVSVCMGEGMTNTFKDLGVDQVIFGGQTMNPSTQDILTAINKTPAETVYVFPNNKNIILVANQAASLVQDKTVIVMPSRNVPQGVSALLSFDESADAETNRATMEDAMGHVTCISTTHAVRDANVDGYDIRNGQAMGLVNEKVKSVADTREECIEALVKGMEDVSFVTIFFGKDVTEADAEKVHAIITENLSDDVDIVVINGGQAVYEYIISLE